MGRAKLKSKNGGGNRHHTVVLFFVRSNEQGNKFRVQISIHVLMDRRAAN
jgi:hypothetical protein